MDNMRELLPCPFCGSQDINGPHQQEYVGDTYSPSWWAECGKCPVFIEVEGGDKSALITAWNRRAQSAAVPVVGDVVAWLVDKPLRHVNMSKSTPIGLGNATQEPLYRAPTTSITAAELDLMRQWFECVQDVNGGFLNPDDFILAKKLYEIIGMRVPHSIIDAAIAGEKQ